MKQWRALIVDDEPFARLELNRLLENYHQILIVGEAGSVSEAQNQIDCLRPDLVFLDIDLGPQTGFDLLELVENNFQTIFVTAYNEFALRAFEVNALDYLLKPINPLRLSDSIDRLGNPYKNVSSTYLKPFDKILVNCGKATRFISVSSIEYIEANGDYTTIYTIEGIKGTLHHTIKKWVDRLPSSVFCQVHRSYIVNINSIDLINTSNNGIKVLTIKRTKINIPVSRRFSKQIDQWKL